MLRRLGGRALMAAVCLIISGVMLCPDRAEAGSIVIPAWSFARGNGQVHTDPNKYADAGPVVVSGERRPEGWQIEYDVDLPVSGYYTLQICYASNEARPVEIFVDGRRMGDWCKGVTFGPPQEGKPDAPTLKSSGAKWEAVGGVGGFAKIWRRSEIAAGMHTVKLARSGPLPHLVALCLETDKEFPKDWKPAQYKVRDMASIPAAHRKAFLSSAVFKTAMPTLVLPKSKPIASLTIPAWSFDRGNAEIYASPDRYADTEPMAGGGQDEACAVEYDIDFPVTAEYTLQVRCAAAEARPVDVYFDGKKLGKTCTDVAISTASIVHPTRPSATSRYATWEGLYDYEKGRLRTVSVTEGKHTLKLARRGPLPNLVTLRLDSSVAFPKEWKQSERKMQHLDRVPASQRAAFLPPEAVNVAALRLSVEQTMKEFGPRYPHGREYLRRLSKLEASPDAAASLDLRREAMLAHPLLDFDKLLFLKRMGGRYSHTYGGPHVSIMNGGSLCVLSPVSTEGKVTPLVPELEGGLFDRFDLSYDAKKVVFGYKKTSKEPFRIYEVDINPAAGTMIPGSLRQLTFGGEEEEEAKRCQTTDWLKGGFNDMYPCYLPSGKIMFASTRAQRIVFCAPSPVTTLYVMDSDGKDVRRLSESPVSETVPSVLHDGRVVYTRWEYVDKGLGNAETLWAMRPDGRGVDHVYKLNTAWPAGMSGARSIPGSQRLVAVAGNHYNPGVGPVVLLDVRRSRRGTEAMHCITPEIGYPQTYTPPKKFGAFADPYPLSDRYFVVSHRPEGIKSGKGAEYGLYLLDGWGNRTPLYRDPAISCFEPMPLRPRHKPLDIAATPNTGTTGEAKLKRPGELFIQDIYQGLTGIERGRVKYVRVMGALEWPWDQRGMSWSLGTDPHRKRIYGVAKVHEDGSAYFSAPAGENLFFQALDENFMALQQMSTFINLMPGEKRSCVGCHERRRKAPRVATARPMAMDHPVQTLMPQPGDTGIRMVDFVADIQPMFDKHCIRCHSGKSPKGHLDLVGVPAGKFSRSYANITGNGLINFRACGSGRAHIRAVPPLTHGSLVSKLPAMLAKRHSKVNVSREEMIKLSTWIDANVPYWGSYRGVLNVQDKDHPDFRMLPEPVAMK